MGDALNAPLAERVCRTISEIYVRNGEARTEFRESVGCRCVGISQVRWFSLFEQMKQIAENYGNVAAFLRKLCVSTKTWIDKSSTAVRLVHRWAIGGKLLKSRSTPTSCSVHHSLHTMAWQYGRTRHCRPHR